MICYNDFRQRLASVYDAAEASAIARLVYEKRCSLSLADILVGKDKQLSADTYEDLEKTLLRLVESEPVQYVLGFAEFCGREFEVNPSVLIPRPETEELCRLVKPMKDAKILDACTGSGCIAITLAASMENAEVWAFDISEEALEVARRNAKSADKNVHFLQCDALKMEEKLGDETFDIIVSNPPYVCEKERISMDRNVLEHEPGLALFVPDDNPLLFYTAITRYAARHLRPNGRLYFEINPKYADEIEDFVNLQGFTQTNIISDSFGKSRFVEARI
ncbi:MAG: peptide chain release factor N(5)-glutamine methyltransferase [Bacteroidaceae bacterium]|nr:peptide chain release factor N(5)-glutamine methyltransferase [Bacteroidaceae bacterium]